LVEHNDITVRGGQDFRN